MFLMRSSYWWNSSIFTPAFYMSHIYLFEIAGIFMNSRKEMQMNAVDWSYT